MNQGHQITAESGATNSLAVTIDVKDAALADSFGIELVTLKNVDGMDKLNKTFELQVVRKEGSKVTFEGNFMSTASGAYKMALRLFPKSADLPHRQDFCYVRWF
jgi:starch phosphorylase